MARADFSTVINGVTLEYFDEDHAYYADGVKIPSVTQILNRKYPHKYDAVDPDKLKAAAIEGTEVHAAIERYVKTGEVDDKHFRMVQHFQFLQRRYGFTVEASEVPMILFYHGEPMAAGRCDLVIRRGGKIVGADVKHTATLDREWVEAQLNLYRIGYLQSYGVEWQELAGIHLYGETRKYVEVKVSTQKALDLITEYLDSKGE